MHIYHARTGAPVVAILRPARTPKGTEVRTVIKHVTKLLRERWPNTRIVWRGDAHYGRVEAMEWIEECLPIRFLPTPPRCRVLPGTGAKLCIGRRSPRFTTLGAIVGAEDRNAGERP